MKIYLAAPANTSDPFVRDEFFDFYSLQSYHYIKKAFRNEGKIHNKYKDFMLDSGVFTYLTSLKEKAKTLDWEKYIYDYGSFVKKYKIQKYVEVDVDKVLGEKEVEKLTKKLEKLVGWKTIPVWHMNRSYDSWLKICKDYDYICFGAFLTDGLKQSKFPMINKFLFDAAKSKTKVHGLGFTSSKLLPLYKFYSVDSSSWSAGRRFGTLYNFNNGKLTTKSFKNRRVKDSHKLSRHDFYEWVKYSQYAEINL
jgi:hypothetical protein